MVTRLVRLSVAVAVAGVLACGSDPVSPPTDWDSWPFGRIVLPGGFNLAAAVTYQADNPDIALVQVTATNTGTTSGTLSYNDCAFGVRVYQGTTATGDPVYHNERNPESACLTITRQLQVAPGATVTVPLPARGIVISALRAKVGSGTHIMTVTYRTEIGGPVIDIPAGQLSFLT